MLLIYILCVLICRLLIIRGYVDMYCVVLMYVYNRFVQPVCLMASTVVSKRHEMDWIKNVFTNEQ